MQRWLLHVDIDVECLWESFKTATETTCDETLGSQKRRHQDWFDDNNAEIEQMIAEKRRRFLSHHLNDIRNVVKINRNTVRDSAWQEKEDNKMPSQFQPLLNSRVQSVREFALPELDCIVIAELM